MDFIEIKINKAVLYLTPDEINRLLQNDISLFATALKRGKGISRNRTQKAREGDKLGKSEADQMNDHLQ